MSKTRDDRYKQWRRRRRQYGPSRTLEYTDVDKLTQVQWSLYLLLCDIDPSAEYDITDWSARGLLNTIERVINATS